MKSCKGFQCEFKAIDWICRKSQPSYLINLQAKILLQQPQKPLNKGKAYGIIYSGDKKEYEMGGIGRVQIQPSLHLLFVLREV